MRVLLCRENHGRLIQQNRPKADSDRKINLVPFDYVNPVSTPMICSLISQLDEATRVMIVLDQINERWGRGTLRSASVPIGLGGMRREMMSQSYTTKFHQLWSIACK